MIQTTSKRIISILLVICMTVALIPSVVAEEEESSVWQPSRMAELTDEEIREIWISSDIRSLTPNTIVTLDALMQRIGEIRRTGYALDNEENEEGVRCIAVSLKDYHKKPVYALSISAPVGRMTDERIRELAVRVLDFKRELTATMGFTAE